MGKGVGDVHASDIAVNYKNVKSLISYHGSEGCAGHPRGSAGDNLSAWQSELPGCLEEAAVEATPAKAQPLRSTGAEAPADTIDACRDFAFEGFRLLGQGSGLFRRSADGTWEQVSIGSRALNVLSVLVQRRGNIVSRDELVSVCSCCRSSH